MSLPPGAVITDLEVRSDRLRYRIQTDMDYRGVYEHLHPQLVEEGWALDGVDWKKDKVEAEYERGDWELEVKVERDGSRRVKIELELDD